MPDRPLRPCTTPGCPVRCPTGRCPDCRAGKLKTKRRRTQATYDYGPRWPAFRLNYLIANPRCVLCGRLSEIPDHWPQSRKALLAAGELNPDQECYVRALCKKCHDKQTAINQPGGWARDRGR